MYPEIKLEPDKGLLLGYNNLTVNEIFDMYLKLNFIYPAKLERLQTVLPQILDNWGKALQLDFPLFWIGTVKSAANNILSTGASWQHLNKGMVGHHLASNNPLGTRIVLLGKLRRIMENQHSGLVDSYQIFYRPQNKYSSKLFGSIAEIVGKNTSMIVPYHYVEMPYLKHSPSSTLEVCEMKEVDRSLFCEFIRRQRSELFIRALELDSEDVNLENLNQIFNKYGLTRNRQIFVAISRPERQIHGVVIVNQASLGLNFSFLENTCDLILSKEITENSRLLAAECLIQKASIKKAGSPLIFIPFLVEPEQSYILEYLKGKISRHYNLIIMMKNGYQAWYDYIDTITAPIFQRFQKYSYEQSNLLPG